MEGQQVSRGRAGRGALSSREHDLGARLPPEWSEHGPSLPRVRAHSLPPTAAVLLAMPCVHVLGGNRAQSSRGHRAALPWASPSRGQCLTQKCPGIWGSATAEGPPSLAGSGRSSGGSSPGAQPCSSHSESRRLSALSCSRLS